ncbi:MAG: exonuclease SbcCD subunit D C-terminal domain-containing protein [Bacteroidota bacterium]|nr:exonuclease SbcCD subunit D C-terminal domain-containing protein [Bacteroidota bacterium]
MKILHTSDWHIGRRLYDKSVDETIEYFFKWLKKTVIEQKIDVLLVAGDIFNNPYPSQSSLKLYYRTLFELSKTNLQQIIITGGNHDSVSNLNAPRELLSALNIVVIGGVSDKIEEMIIEVKNEQNNVELVVAAVPFLRERDIRTSGSGNSFQQRVEKISKGIEDFYNQISQQLSKYKKQNIPVIAMGHLFVNDVSDMSKEERELYIGGLQQISFKQIPNIFDYFALGHIHKPMRIGKRDNIRYCGSPIHLNFSEINYKSQVVVVNFNDNKIDIEQVFVPQFRDLLHLKGTFNEVYEQIINYSNKKELNAWADIEIIEQKQDLALDKKISALKEELQDIEIIRSRYIFTDIEKDIENRFEKNTNINDLKPIEVFEQVLQNANKEDREILKDTFVELVQNYLDD